MNPKFRPSKQVPVLIIAFIAIAINCAILNLHFIFMLLFFVLCDKRYQLLAASCPFIRRARNQQRVNNAKKNLLVNVFIERFATWMVKMLIGI